MTNVLVVGGTGVLGRAVASALAGRGAVVRVASRSTGVDVATGAGLEAGARAGVAHHVGVSIVGIDRVPMGYYRVKLEQERAIEAGAVPWTIVRATQFHELLRQWLDGAVRPFRGLPFQPAAASDVGAAVADVALGPPRRGRVTVAGPEVLDAAELVRLTGRRTLLVPVPGRTAAAIRAGGLTDPAPDVRTATTFERWLKTT